MQFGNNQTPIIVLSQNTTRESGRKVQLDNIEAAKLVADIVRTCLGPQAMLKMLMDPMGGIVMTNDGNVILREISVKHPAAKTMIDTARTQDEEAGDGTTSVVVLAGELLVAAEPFLRQQIHPTVIIREYQKALQEIETLLNGPLSITVDKNDDAIVSAIIRGCISTKCLSEWSKMAVDIALKAVKTVMIEENGRIDIDIKNYAKIEKLPGGSAEDSRILDGVMLNKDITHPQMKRYIKNPRIVLLDCSLEYKKGESQLNVEITAGKNFTRLLELEEEFVAKQCADIIAVKPNLVITEKGVSDLAQHYLVKAGISAIRRVRKTDNNRIARACGARIVNRTDELTAADVGTGCGLFEIKKVGDEYFCFLTECSNPKACTIVLSGVSKDILNEMERNLHDALHVARSIMLNPRVVPGGGAVEMALSHALSSTTTTQSARCAVADALKIIPKTLAQNCGANVIRTLTALQSRHANHNDSTKPCAWGIDGNSGEIIEHEVDGVGLWEPLAVKQHVYKTAIETATLLLRIDDIVSGSKKKNDEGTGPKAVPVEGQKPGGPEEE